MTSTVSLQQQVCSWRLCSISWARVQRHSNEKNARQRGLINEARRNSLPLRSNCPMVAAGTCGFHIWHSCSGEGNQICRKQIQRAGSRLWEQRPIYRRTTETWFYADGRRYFVGDDLACKAPAS